MLNDRSREILFWFTVGMIALVAVVAVITILRSCGGPIVAVTPLEINAAEASLCPGESYQFTVGDGVEVTWEATGGTVSSNGLFTAGDVPGDYVVTARSDSRRVQAMVHVLVCTPTPTSTPLPTPTPTVPPTVTPTPEPTPIPPADPQGDVGAYESGAPVEGVPAGVDIRAASVASDLRVTLQPVEGMPPELEGWAGEGQVLLWMSLYQPIPAPLQVFSDWLFVLDLDGDPATGRPAGAARINPELGTEAAVGVSYNPAVGKFEPYLWVWDAAAGEWTEKPDVVSLYTDESRTLIGLALSLETLAQHVAEASGVTIVPDAVRGRAAALSYAGEQAVVDFYPER
jgi:hypothetical protein